MTGCRLANESIEGKRIEGMIRFTNNCLSPPHPASTLVTADSRVCRKRRSNHGVSNVCHTGRNKNTRPKTRRIDYRVCTFNCRSVATDDRLAELLEETKTIKYDIIGLSETKRAAETHMMHRDGTGVFLGKRNTTSVSGGVGFIVNSTLLPKIQEIKFLNHRIAYLTFQVDRRLSCTVFQVYAPVADSDPEELADFYESLEEAYTACRSRYKLVILNHYNDLEPELHRRRRAAWAAFNNIKNTTDALSCPRIRAQLFDSIVLPALTYGSEVWTFTQALSERVRVTHAALERRLVGISLSEQRQRNLHREDIRAQSEVRDPLLVIKKKKLGWAGHIMRRNDGRWTRLVQEWYPIGEKRPVGRPRMRWSDSLKEQISLFDGNHLKTHWSTIAKDRMAWKAVIRDHIR
uniref:Endonuclease/exonuclease/phosphatase domain-containing protein n=1 Tax=Caenorhabditis japonica TaxID=281687 RepID=A0A8R1IYR0_CAEJA